MADVEEMMISGWLRLVMCGRRIVSRTAAKTGKLIGNRIVGKTDGLIAEKIAAPMLVERCAGWIVPIRWPEIVGSRGGIMPVLLRWTGPTGLSEPTVRNDRSALSDRRDRNVRTDLNGLVITNSAFAVGGNETTVSGDFSGAVNFEVVRAVVRVVYWDKMPQNRELVIR